MASARFDLAISMCVKCGTVPPAHGSRGRSRNPWDRIHVPTAPLRYLEAYHMAVIDDERFSHAREGKGDQVGSGYGSSPGPGWLLATGEGGRTGTTVSYRVSPEEARLSVRHSRYATL